MNILFLTQAKAFYARHNARMAARHAAPPLLEATRATLDAYYAAPNRDLDALLAGDPSGRGGEDASPASASKKNAFSSPPSPARILKPWAERGGGARGGDAAAGAFARKKGPASAGLATGRRRATRM